MSQYLEFQFGLYLSGKKILNLAFKKYSVKSVDWIVATQGMVTEFDSPKLRKKSLVS